MPKAWGSRKRSCWRGLWESSEWENRSLTRKSAVVPARKNTSSDLSREKPPISLSLYCTPIQSLFNQKNPNREEMERRKKRPLMFALGKRNQITKNCGSRGVRWVSVYILWARESTVKMKEYRTKEKEREEEEVGCVRLVSEKREAIQ